MIYFNKVSFGFESGNGIKNATFTIEKGEYVCIIGPTGAGKTTLLKLIYMDLLPEEGEIKVENYSSKKIKNKDIAFLRRKVGMVFQNSQLLNDRNVFENIAIPLHVQGVGLNHIKNEVNEVLIKLGIEDKKNHFPNQLSGGEQQIISLARELVKNPIVILADEPTGNLDPASSLKVLRMLEEINNDGTGVIMATHNFTLVEDRGHQFMQIKNGEVTL